MSLYRLCGIPIVALPEQAALDCLRAARFYATNGLEIERVSLQGNELYVEAHARRPTYTGAIVEAAGDRLRPEVLPSPARSRHADTRLCRTMCTCASIRPQGSKASRCAARDGMPPVGLEPTLERF